jgi:hypothetical protein
MKVNAIGLLQRDKLRNAHCGNRNLAATIAQPHRSIANIAGELDERACRALMLCATAPSASPSFLTSAARPAACMGGDGMQLYAFDGVGRHALAATVAVAVAVAVAGGGAGDVGGCVDLTARDRPRRCYRRRCCSGRWTSPPRRASCRWGTQRERSMRRPFRGDLEAVSPKRICV